MLAPARPQIAAYATARSPSAARPSRASGAKPKWAAVAAALMCVWTIYADPIAREKALILLRPLLAEVVPTAPSVKLGPASAHREEIGGQTVLYVEGSLSNTTARKLKSPTLRISLIGDDGQPLYAWKARPAAAEMGPRAEVAFRTRLASPPPSFKSVAVSLADGS
jgi:hypothetical protein